MEQEEQQIPPNSFEEQIQRLDGVISNHPPLPTGGDFINININATTTRTAWDNNSFFYYSTQGITINDSGSMTTRLVYTDEYGRVTNDTDFVEPKKYNIFENLTLIKEE